MINDEGKIMADTKIAWAEKVWNPVTGCAKISDGCRNCYAEGIFKRFGKKWGYGFNNIVFHKNRLDQPKSWIKPSRIFVCSMGDLFHEGVDEGQINQIISAMESTPRHTFMVLTKRASAMKAFFKFSYYGTSSVGNLWLGVSVENLRHKSRIDILRTVPAQVRYLSLEPLIGDMGHLNLKGISWVIVGSESGPDRRPCKIEWVRKIVEQCREAGVPIFVKQLHIDGKLSGNMEEWPKDLRIQEFPK